MEKPKGGRGQTAPYETKQMRVPTPMEPQIQELITRYRDWISESARQRLGSSNPPKLLDKLADKLPGSYSIISRDDLEEDEEEEDTYEEPEDLNRVIREQAEKNQTLLTEVRMLERELAEERSRSSTLKLQLELVERESELLRTKIGDLDLALVNCREELEQVKTEANNCSLDNPLNLSTNLKPLRMRALAERLGQESHSYISKIKQSTGFSGWSRERDPDKVAWRYDPESKLFFPVDCQ